MEQGSSYLLSNNLRNATVGFKAGTFSLFFYFIIFIIIIIILFKMYLALTFKYTLFILSRWPPSLPLQFKYPFLSIPLQLIVARVRSENASCSHCIEGEWERKAKCCEEKSTFPKIYVENCK